MKNQATDYQLVRQFIDGDNSGIEILIHRHKTKLFTYISMYIRDKSFAEDIFQETFLKVMSDKLPSGGEI